MGWQAWQAVKPDSSRPTSSPPHGLRRTSENSDKRTYFYLKQIEQNHSWQFKKVPVPLNPKGKNSLDQDWAQEPGQRPLGGMATTKTLYHPETLQQFYNTRFEDSCIFGLFDWNV